MTYIPAIAWEEQQMMILMPALY